MNPGKVIFMVCLISLFAGLIPLHCLAENQSGSVPTPPALLKIAIYFVSDSTCSYYEPQRFPRTGWGQVFPKFLKADCGIVVNNTAKSGRSTRSFITEGWWDKIKASLKPGDYVLIQMGHNDQDTAAGSTRATTPEQYRQYLVQYVEETRTAGAIPVLLTPVERWHFNANGVFTTSHAPSYTDQVKTVAVAKTVPFIDLQLQSRELLVGLGASEAEKLFMTFGPEAWPQNYPKGSSDHTHFTYEGALRIAALVAQGIQAKIPQLAPYIAWNGDTKIR